MQVTTGPTAGRFVRFTLAAVIAAAAAVVPAGTAVAKPTPTPTQKAAAIVLPAVLYLEVHWEGWIRDRVTGARIEPKSVTGVSRCSGFAVTNDGYIVTTAACLDLARIAPTLFGQVAQRRIDAGEYTAADKPALVANLLATATIGGETTSDAPVRAVYAQRGPAKAGLTSGEALPAQVVPLEPATDDPPGTAEVGLVKIEKSNQPIVTLTDASDLKVGTPLEVVGYRAASDAGDTTLTPVDDDAKISVAGTETADPLYQSTATATADMAGGPLVDLNGNVLGLVGSDPATAQGSRFLVRSSVISDVLAKAQVKNQLGKVDKDYRAGLAAYYDGRYTEAIEAFDQVLAAVPSHAQAQGYRQDALNRRRTEGAGAEVERSLLTRYSSTIIVVAAVIVLLLGLILGSRWRARAAAHLAPAPNGEDPAAPSEGSAPASTVDSSRAASAKASGDNAPALVYCVNCGVGSSTGTGACETCGKPFPGHAQPAAAP
jgi:serine protease Do